jgi:hypothetical protein
MVICSAWVGFVGQLCEIYKYGPLGRDAVWYSRLVPTKRGANLQRTRRHIFNLILQPRLHQTYYMAESIATSADN